MTARVAPQRRSHRTHRTIIAATVGMLLVAAGCSDTDQDSVDATPRADAAAPASSDPAGEGAHDTATVVGAGTVAVPPDQAQFTIGVEVTAAEVGTAIDEAATRADAVVAALRDAGLGDDQLRTTRYEVREQRSEPTAPGGPPEISGYVVTNSVEATTDQLDDLGRLLAAAAEAGGDATRIDGPRFTTRDVTAAREEARQAAFEDAQRRAAQYAELAGRQLGELRSVEELESSSPGPVTPEVAAGAPPILPGSNSIEVRVRAVWDLTAA